MYRLKIYSLSKEERNKLKEEFYNTDIGKDLKLRLTRLLIIGILGILFSIYMFISNTSIFDIIIGIILLIASIIFIIASFRLRITKLNDYLVKKKGPINLTVSNE